MKAFRYYGQGKTRLENIEKPPIEKGKVLIKVSYVSLCGTDLAILKDLGPVWTKTPVILGHEICGIVAETGKGVSENIKKGDKVVIDNNLSCNSCSECKKGNFYWCDSHGEIGMTIDGGLAEYCIVPEINIIKISDTLELRDAVITEPLANAIKAVETGSVSLGDLVLVMGGGPMGTLISLVCQAKGARVIVVEKDRNRIDRLNKMNFEFVIDSDKDNWIEIIKKRYGKYNASWGWQVVDKFIDATDTGVLVADALRLIKRKGTAVLLGLSKGEGEFNLPRNEIVFKDIKLLGSSSANGKFYDAVEFLEKKYIDTDLVITHCYPLEEIEEAINCFINRKDGAMKVIVKIN